MRSSTTTITVLATALAGAQLASAHFGLVYPPWRADTLSEESEEIYSQWEHPCAGVNTTTNRTAWPIGGGAIELELHHPWAYVWVNLGLGDNTTNFNISLTPDLYNISGKGDFCWPKLPVPIEIADGTNATIQVVTGGASGSALYNCADITFRADAPVHECANSTQFDVTVIRNGEAIVGGTATSGGSSQTPAGSSATPAASTSKPAAGVSVGVSLATLSAAAGVALVFALGL
ncbi:uncharacterized protein B0I36DRAFT_346528 [Microdochium trichocladiopsis]|uniref:Copper acquisition factor BIM1-like domain-containing protein n=1 Tax=Microdochium trichocladiopsis TaxID=1682393 RepID=A0A9P9BQ87_9PEZI|nr:uncharacterized protein B0I36DRAFT_346528 [Microdochium trichocladiopsis]KAH7034618.1 hypothetical protein B0I36DRAFT_346528 [Microdochium trichocladiopsis]